MIADRSFNQKALDQEKLAEIAKTDPNLILAEKPAQFTAEFLSKIGIDYNPGKISDGFIKLFPEDFIVEEIANDSRIIDISPEEINLPEEISNSRPQVDADMVKRGIGTLEAVEKISLTLDINPSDIHYAGFKDSRAITAQTITISGTAPEKIQEIVIPNIFLKNIHQRKGVREIGNLKGNKFSILIRTDKIDTEKLVSKLKKIKSEGFYNFFSLQRFGSRLINTELGRLILQGNYEQAVKTFLTSTTLCENRIICNIRTEAGKSWGNWEKMTEVFSKFPSVFYYELTLLESLQKNDGKYLLGLKTIEDQSKMFVYAYGSFCFNKLLSLYAKSGEQIPESLPILADVSKVLELYKKVVSEEELKTLIFQQPAFPTMTMTKIRQNPTKIFPEIHKIYELPVGYVISFSLGKGAYATTFLAEFFDLFQGEPVPSWVDKTKCDVKAVLGETSISQTQNKFPKDDENQPNSLISEY
ncbi:MAG: tRNA pseudouridine(13) synthase TruD [Candidatus Berkelbacteria bacterium]|nr:tRNA pseudouridine(13) synthase TruD [Candidatus Berkelbacteria bacterium]